MALSGEYDLKKVSADLHKIINEGTKRCLKNTVKWAAELNRALVDHINSDSNVDVAERMDPEEDANYHLAISDFDFQEYDRAAFLLKNSQTRLGKFLRYYSMYCSVEKKRLDDIAEAYSPNEESKISVLKSLRVKLQKDHLRGSLDGYCLYLYGVVLKKLQLEKDALKILCEAVHKEPLYWGCWLELATLISDREMLNELTLPDCWIKDFFLAHTYLKFPMNESAMEIYSRLSDAGFSKSTYVMAQIAIAHQNMGNFDEAIAIFQDIQRVDPFQLDYMDIYSNILHAKKMRLELSNLAEKTCNIDQYRQETLHIIGNLYSSLLEPERAVLYFHKALKINPSYSLPWTLIGHQYLVMQNSRYAIQAYHQAIEVNKEDFRAWYGLAQTYQIIKMPFYSIYYYKQAHRLQPYNSRVMVALGEMYEKLGKLRVAKEWFWKACAAGDIDGMASIYLAKIYEKLNEEDASDP